MAGCLLRIREIMNSLTPKEKKVASYILEYPAEVVGHSIEELARISQVSISTVVRLCKSLGYSGYKELLRMLSTDLVLMQQDSITYTDVRPGDSIDMIVRSVSMSNTKAIENTLSVLDEKELLRAIDVICQAERVDFYGVGSSGNVALDANNKFMRINKISIASQDPHVQILSATTLKAGDVAVLISYSGETMDILETAEIVRQSGATIISITRLGKNPLSELADIRLYSSSVEGMVRSGAMSSRIGQLNIIDILYTAVTSCEYDKVKPYLDRTRIATSHKRVRSS
ncbi:MAG: MurR/RpiR family transcriptional regulator [Clostridiaceae bacterium]|nr:MurR/RpiR family transcriptional regulator [Clostridiales bacterium]MDD2441738.1 MurR/RpiR family transcriptional regulator [Eubacteriales bacterium]MDD4139964.1 MurR/RpiR family transcriptional regulator [Eubacteriales bacterium]MDD4743077.1 MurR/RpiR family transcriptional regulator [Eubacteriales bacterium]NLB45160.1 MurR/RpiR family transcriptional regulator [Clostridiaceae bacterium]